MDKVKTSGWLALRVKRHSERKVIEQLKSGGVGHYCPFMEVKPVNPRSNKWKPYFPGYMFVQASPVSESILFLERLPGTIGLVKFGGEPAVTPDAVIQNLRQRISDIEAAGGIEMYGFQKGDHVVITAGPFEGYEAIFDERIEGDERVQVLLSFLSQYPQRAQLDASTLRRSSRRRRRKRR